MKFELNVQVRTVQGTGASRRLRHANKVPGIIYGGTAAPTLIELDHNSLLLALRKEAFHASMLTLKVGDTVETVLLRDSHMHPYKPLVLLAGVLGGMVWAGLVALLRDRFNANEILVSLMLVYVATLVLSYLVFGPWKDPMGYNFPQTKTFDAATQIPKLMQGSRVNIGLLLALAGVAGVWLFLFRTYAGFAQIVGGLAPAAARYAGFSSRKALWIALLTSGGAAGLAGALEVAGPIGQLTPYVPVGYGFAAIIVAFVGRLHPVGIVFSAILMSMFYIGGELAQSRLGLPKSITGVFQGLLLFALLACDTLIAYRVVWKKR